MLIQFRITEAAAKRLTAAANAKQVKPNKLAQQIVTESLGLKTTPKRHFETGSKADRQQRAKEAARARWGE